LNSNKIFTFGDGFATGHLWPEWPQILQALLPDYQVINTAGIGAGCEFLVSGFVDQVNNMQNSLIIFQWPDHQRFDKMIEDKHWRQIIKNDPVYHFNIVLDSQHQPWWLSSASTAAEVQLYHGQYVQTRQHKNRHRVYQTLVNHTASSLNCNIFHTTTQDEDNFSRENRFATTRQAEVQPSPFVHLLWLVERVLPQVAIVVSTARYNRLEQLINQTHWVPYDCDRTEIWKNICSRL